MAEEMVDDLPGHSCNVCFEKFCASDARRVPRNLKCGHTFCTGCCVRLLKSEVIDCPKCHERTACVGGSGVDRLVKNFGVLDIVESTTMMSPLHGAGGTTSGSSIGAERRSLSSPVNCAVDGPATAAPSASGAVAVEVYRCYSCLEQQQQLCLFACADCRAVLCTSCSEAVHRIPGFREHHVVSTAGMTALQINRLLRQSDSTLLTTTGPASSSLQDARLHCDDHDGERKKVFCRTCNMLVCIYCQLHGAHQQHDCVLAREHALSERVRLDRLCTAVEQRKQQWLQAYAGVMDMSETVRHSSARLEDDVSAHFRGLRHCLEQRESALRQVLRVFIDERLGMLSEQACNLTALSERAKNIIQLGGDAMQSEAMTLLLEAPRLTHDIQSLLLVMTPLGAQARDDIVFRWPQLAMASSSEQHTLDDVVGNDWDSPGAGGGDVGSGHDVGAAAAGRNAIDSRSLSELITHHGELMILPPAISPCHCTPYLHAIRIFWSPVDMPDQPLLEYRVEHICWIATAADDAGSALGASAAAAAVVRDLVPSQADDDVGACRVVYCGAEQPLPRCPATPTRPAVPNGDVAASAAARSPPRGAGDAAAARGGGTTGVAVAAAAAVASPPTARTGGAVGRTLAEVAGGPMEDEDRYSTLVASARQSVSLPRPGQRTAGMPVHGHDATVSKGPRVAYVKDHFSGEEDMDAAEDDDFDDIDDLNETDSHVLFDMHRDKPPYSNPAAAGSSTPNGQHTGITVEPLHVKSPPVGSPAVARGAKADSRDTTAAATARPISLLPHQSTAAACAPGESLLSSRPGSREGRAGVKSASSLDEEAPESRVRVVSDPLERAGVAVTTGPAVGFNTMTTTPPLMRGVRPTASFPLPSSLALSAALPMPRSTSAPAGGLEAGGVVGSSGSGGGGDGGDDTTPGALGAGGAGGVTGVRDQRRPSIDEESVFEDKDTHQEMMSVRVHDQKNSTTKVVKTPVSAAPRELTLESAQLAGHGTSSIGATSDSGAVAMPPPSSSSGMLLQSPSPFRKAPPPSQGGGESARPSNAPAVVVGNAPAATGRATATVAMTTANGDARTCNGLASTSESSLAASSSSSSMMSCGGGGRSMHYREARFTVYRGKSRTFDLKHNFPPNSEHGFRVSACSRAGKGPWSPVTRIAIPGPAFTWNSRACHSQVTVSSDGLTAAIESNRFWVTVGADTVLRKGCHYWECVLKQYGEPSRNWKVVVGVVAAKVPDTMWRRDKATIGIARHGMTASSWGYVTAQGKKVSTLTTSSWGSDYASTGPYGRCVEGDTVGVLLDLDTGTLEFYHNGHSLGVAFDKVNVPVVPAISFYHDKAVQLRFAPPPLL